MVTNTFIAPFTVDQNMDLTTMVNKCGANIYDFQNSTITFVLKSQPKCILKVRTIDSVRLNLKLNVTVEDFYSNDAQTTFIDKISTFLGIDMSNIRIAVVGTSSNSVNLALIPNVPLQPSTSSNDSLYNPDNYTDTDDGSDMNALLSNYAIQIAQAVNNGSLVLSTANNLNGSPRLVETSNIKEYSNNKDNSENATTTIVLFSILITLVCLIGLGIACFYKKKMETLLSN